MVTQEVTQLELQPSILTGISSSTDMPLQQQLSPVPSKLHGSLLLSIRSPLC